MTLAQPKPRIHYMHTFRSSAECYVRKERVLIVLYFQLNVSVTQYTRGERRLVYLVHFVHIYRYLNYSSVYKRCVENKYRQWMVPFPYFLPNAVNYNIFPLLLLLLISVIQRRDWCRFLNPANARRIIYTLPPPLIFYVKLSFFYILITTLRSSGDIRFSIYYHVFTFMTPRLEPSDVSATVSKAYTEAEYRNITTKKNYVESRL